MVLETGPATGLFHRENRNRSGNTGSTTIRSRARIPEGLRPVPAFLWTPQLISSFLLYFSLFSQSIVIKRLQKGHHHVGGGHRVARKDVGRGRQAGPPRARNSRLGPAPRWEAQSCKGKFQKVLIWTEALRPPWGSDAGGEGRSEGKSLPLVLVLRAKPRPGTKALLLSVGVPWAATLQPPGASFGSLAVLRPPQVWKTPRRYSGVQWATRRGPSVTSGVP